MNGRQYCSANKSTKHSRASTYYSVEENGSHSRKFERGGEEERSIHTQIDLFVRSEKKARRKKTMYIFDRTRWTTMAHTHRMRNAECVYNGHVLLWFVLRMHVLHKFIMNLFVFPFAFIDAINSQWSSLFEWKFQRKLPGSPSIDKPFVFSHKVNLNHKNNAIVNLWRTTNRRWMQANRISSYSSELGHIALIRWPQLNGNSIPSTACESLHYLIRPP